MNRSSLMSAVAGAVVLCGAGIEQTSAASDLAGESSVGTGSVAACLNRKSAVLDAQRGLWCVAGVDGYRSNALVTLIADTGRDVWTLDGAGANHEVVPRTAAIEVCAIGGQNFTSLPHAGWDHHVVQIRDGNETVQDALRLSKTCSELILEDITGGQLEDLSLRMFATGNGNLAVFGYWRIKH